MIDEILQRMEAEAARLETDGQDQAAAQLCFQGLNQFGDTIGLLSPLARIFLKLGDLTRAEDYFRRLAVLAPKDVGILASHANILMALERNQDAADAYTRLLRLEPEHQTSLVNLGMLLVKMQRAGEAVEPLGRAARQAPGNGLVQVWLGYAYSALDRLEEAIACYEAVHDDPEYGVQVWMPLAIAYRAAGRLDRANEVLRYMIGKMPGHPLARFALAQNQLTAGNFAEGFANYESRWERPGGGRPQMIAPLWQGEPLSGKTILVHDEQGFGDCIQFCRFLKPLQEQGARVIFQVRPKLRQLLDGIAGVDEFTAPGAGKADFHIPLLSLPLRLGVTCETVPDAPYLRVPEEGRERWAGRLGPKTGLRVGLVWQGEPGSQAEVGRSVPYETIRRIFDVAGCEFFILQKYHGRKQLAVEDLPPHVHDLGDEIDNGGDAFVDTAAIMANLDVMVSSDTAAAHLAGALGVPAYVLLKSVPEWRWMLDRGDSIWYRDMTLLRQGERGNWPPVLDQLRQLLEQRVAKAG